MLNTPLGAIDEFRSLASDPHGGDASLRRGTNPRADGVRARLPFKDGPG